VLTFSCGDATRRRHPCHRDERDANSGARGTTILVTAAADFVADATAVAVSAPASRSAW